MKRSRVVSHLAGGSRFGSDGSEHYQYGDDYYTQSQTSYHSPGPPYTARNYFLQVNEKRGSIRYTGIQDAGYRTLTYNNYKLVGLSRESRNDSLSKAELVNQALASINPGKPIMDLPLFLFELREFPRLLRDLGFHKLGKKPSGSPVDPGGTYLSYKFGWAPLINDVRTLLNLSDSIKKRMKQLREGNSDKSMSGTLPGSDLSWSSSKSLYYFGYLRYDLKFRQQRENWYTTGFQFDESQLPDVDDSYVDSLKWALGLNASAETVWNAIPWSWLVDYFSNIGTFLATRRGNIHYVAKDMCLMRKSTTTCTFEVTSNKSAYTSNGLKMDPFLYERLEREVIYHPTPMLSFSPFLSGGQLNILSALAASTVARSLK